MFIHQTVRRNRSEFKIRTIKAGEYTVMSMEYEGYNPDVQPLGSKLLLDKLIFFNKENGNFIYVSSDRSKYGFVNNKVDNEMHLFGKYPMEAPGCDLLYFGQSDGKIGYMAGGDTGYALFQKQTYPDSLFMYWFATNEACGMLGYSPLYRIDTLSGKKLAMAKASHRTIHQDGSFMYFASGNTVSRYDLKEQQEHYGVLTLSGEITWMKYVRNDYTDKNLQFNSLLIATYDTGTDTYTLGLYDIDSTGNPKPEPHTELKGSGRLQTAKYVVPVNTAGRTYFKHYYYY